jgi:hypothetical protein
VRINAAILVCCAALLPGCATAPMSYNRASAMTQRMDETDRSLARAAREIDSAVNSLNGLQGKSGADLRQQYIIFIRRVNNLEAEQKRVAARENQLEETARTYFRAWEDDLRRFSSADMKKKSRQRLMNTMDSYNRMFDALQVEDESYRIILNDMRDLRRYLGYDLTQDSVNSLGENIKRINQDAQTARQKISEASKELQVTQSPVSSDTGAPQYQQSQNQPAQNRTSQ